ncbi:MAG: S9 family peptidase [Verrucomicrobiales bacterium]|nr:S9 family peptidase [Verrucomicrobiales bacterium]
MRILRALLLSWLPFLQCPAADPHPLSVDDLWSLKRLGTPSLSPDGRWVVAEVTSFDMTENESTSDLWLLGTDGKRQRQLTAHKAKDSGPAWSPDGRWIVFTSKREGDDQPQLYVIQPDGGEARRITKISTGASSPRWFSDAKRLAFLSNVWPDLRTDEDQGKRLKQKADAKVKAYAIESTHYRYWDRWMADDRVTHVFTVDLDTGATRDLMVGWTNGIRALEPSNDLYDVAPDGNEIAFVADLGSDPGRSPNTDIVTVSVPDGSREVLTADNPAHDSSPRYSPDGTSLAWLRRVKPRFYAERPRMAVWNRAARTYHVLTEDWDLSPSSATWSSDSSRLVFTAEDQGRNPLWSIDVAGGRPTRILAGTVGGFDISRDRSLVVATLSTLSQPGQIQALPVMGLDSEISAAPVAIESFNTTLIGSWKLGVVAQTNIAGWNGEPVQSWITYPPDFDPQKKWPLLQMVHGGPHGAWNDEFHFRWNSQVFAAKGYVVVGVNFHGSTGWGQAFVESSVGRYGEKEFADVEAMTDAMLARGYIDPDRLVAAGGSFGGYMMAVINGRTRRYKAHICHAGVYNWESMLASDFAGTLNESLGVFPWDDRERYLRQSAHLGAAKFSTPTLVVHGEQDFRVPVSQGFEYFNTLRVRGVPARLLYFPDENHWVLKPQNGRLWHEEFFGWLARYAPGGGR